jgi:hypothetical protein
VRLPESPGKSGPWPGFSAGCIGGFGLYLHSLGLPWLPSSVLVKSQVANADMNISDSALAGFLVTLVRNLANNLDAYGGVQIAVMVAALLAVWGRPIPPRASVGSGEGGGRQFRGSGQHHYIHLVARV